MFNLFRRRNRKLDITQVKTPRPANLKGENGKKCLECVGYGFTIRFPDGKVLFCKQCKQTGVKL